MKTVLGLMLAFVTCAVAAEPLAQAASGLATPPAAESIFAIINGKRVFVLDYDALFATVLRQRFYHGKIPEGQAAIVQKEVTDLLISRELLLAAAMRQGLKPEAGKFEQMVAAYDARYAAAPEWQQRRAQLLPEIKEQVERQSLIEQYEKSVRHVPRPTVKEARAYYEYNPVLFTQPEKLHLSVILLKVDPAASKEIWEKARAEAQAIAAKAKAQAAQDAENRVAKADAEITAKLAVADAELATARNKALASIETVAADAAQDIVAKIAGTKINAADAAKAVKAVLANG